MIKVLAFLLLNTVASCVFAALPTSYLLNACAKGMSTNGIGIEPVIFTEINEMDKYWREYIVTYTIFMGKEIGYARKENKQGVVLGGQVFETIPFHTTHLAL